MNANVNSSLSLLDSTLDDLADMPEFKVYPNGAHIVTISFEEKSVNDHPCVELKMVAVSTEELANPEDTPLVAGDTGSVLYMLDNEFGQGSLKAVLKPLGQYFGIGNLREIMDAANGAECMVVTKQRQNKEKTQTYLSVTSINVV
jgi:hypothetical protein